jgi:uncharacterized protein
MLTPLSSYSPKTICGDCCTHRTRLLDSPNSHFLEKLFVVDVPSDKQNVPAEVPTPEVAETGASAQEVDAPQAIDTEAPEVTPPETKASAEAVSPEIAAELAKRSSTIAAGLNLKQPGIDRALALFDAGYAVPFVAHYRRAETGNLNETQLESVYEAYLLYRSLADRRKAILQTLSERGVLSEDLRNAINACRDKIELEDLYLPLKRRERTKATIAVDKGLGPLADILNDPDQDATQLDELAAPFIRPEKSVNTVEEALEGVREILCETFTHHAELRRKLRARILSSGRLKIYPTKTSEPSAARFKPFFDTTEDLSKIPAQKFLQVMRGVRTGALRTVVEIDDTKLFEELAKTGIREGESPAITLLRECLQLAYDQTMRPAAERDSMAIMQDRSDAGAIRAFRDNARNRLMAPPAGAIPVLGITANQNESASWAAVDASGAHVAGETIAAAMADECAVLRESLAKAMEAHGIRAVAIGRGDRSGVVLRAVREVLRGKGQESCYCTIVQEAGHPVAAHAASSDPGQDPQVAIAAVIARQHQDPLAELVKLDPRHIGIGQNFHEVNQKRLREALQRSIMSCVCRVGLNLNTASAALLGHVCGIQPATAENIVKRRTEEGLFTSRRQLLDIAGVGPKVYEQAVAFLRIPDGEQPLDALAVHPTYYAAIDSAAQQAGANLTELWTNDGALDGILEALGNAEGLEATTIDTIRHTIRKGKRDPRGSYRPPSFQDAVRTVADLEPGAAMEGVVTNVADFGAFVEVGVGQDGLVHLSELANGFVRDPRQVVSVGQTVTVKVLNVDKDKPRISLSIKALQPVKPRRPKQDAKKKPAADSSASDAPKRREEASSRETRRPQNARAQRDRKQSKPNQRRPKDRPQRGKKKTPLLPEQDNQPLTNNLLADQLEALKDRLGT